MVALAVVACVAQGATALMEVGALALSRQDRAARRFWPLALLVLVAEPQTTLAAAVVALARLLRQIAQQAAAELLQALLAPR